MCAARTMSDLAVPAGPMTGMMAPVGGSGGSVSLATLIEFFVQRTYHELVVLSELLPRKSDMERKLEIVQYAARTRQLCVRLLALVKWAGSVNKVNKSAGIMAFLDKQSALFVDTADQLALMARRHLSSARLPMFHVPVAAELLSTGGYSRLPLCVRERIVPPPSVTPAQRRATLLRLNHVIEQRLACAPCPPRPLQLRVAAGRVRFTARDEFSVTLTLLGEGARVPWTLLDVRVLVPHPDSARSLVHPLQLIFLRRLVEGQLSAGKPLSHVFHLLHSFCLGLQLEVLHVQLMQLVRHRLADSVRLHRYQPGTLLSLAYWPHAGPVYRLQIHADGESGLRVTHVPALPEGRGTGPAGSSLCLERLLVSTVQRRSEALLEELRSVLVALLSLDTALISLDDCPSGPRLLVPLLLPCRPTERLLVFMHVQRGLPVCVAPDCVPAPLLTDLGSALAAVTGVGNVQSSSDHSQRLLSVLGAVRSRLLLSRAQRSLQHVPASVHDALPLWWSCSRPLSSNSSGELLYIRLHRHPGHVLLLAAESPPLTPCRPHLRLFVAAVRAVSHVHTAASSSGGEAAPLSAELVALPSRCLKVLTCVELDSAVCAESEGMQVAGCVPTAGKRSSPHGDFDWGGSRAKRARQEEEFPPSIVLARSVALCDELVPFTALCRELSRRGVVHDGAPAPDERGAGRCLRVLRLPAPEGVEPRHVQRLERAVLSVTMRHHHDGHSTAAARWTTELVLYGPNFCQTENPATLHRRVLCFHYSGEGAVVVDKLLADWHKMAALYSLMLGWRAWLRRESPLAADVSVTAFNYRSATLTYGGIRGTWSRVEFCCDSRRFRLAFGAASSTNPHSLTNYQLEEVLNHSRCLPQLACVLHESLPVLGALQRLKGAPRLGVRGDRPLEPVCDFVLVPQTGCHVRVLYRRVHCVSVCVVGGGQVALRDGAFSGVERGRQLEEIVPVPCLSVFLSRFRDGASSVGTEGCDILPSPAALELDLGPPAVPMARPSVPVCGSPAAARDARFAHPMTPGSSNPHTPASPLQPSPATQQAPAVPHSPGSVLHAPSPSGGFLPAPSPGHVGHSPAAAMSPFAACTQPLPSPSMQPHVQPAAALAASQPLLLSCHALETLCTRVRSAADAVAASPLERFLGCVYTVNHLRRTLDEEPKIGRTAGDQGAVVFRTQCLQCRVRLEPERLQSLHLSLQPVPEALDQWLPEQLHVLERFFDSRVAVPPYRHNALKTFVRILNTQANVLRDFIRILQLEEMTVAAAANDAQLPPNTNWVVEWCTTSPPSVPALIPTGVVSLMNAGSKLLFFVQLTRRSAGPLAPGTEPVRLVLPIVYNLHENSTQCADRKDASPSQLIAVVNHMMRRSSEAAAQTGECSVFPAVRDVVYSLTLPTDHVPLELPPQQRAPPRQMPGPRPFTPQGMVAMTFPGQPPQAP